MALNPSTGWGYYKQIDISDTATVSADYQMKLTVYSGSGDDSTADGVIYCDNHCESFPNDIRFGTTNNPSTATQLGQWIETYDATSAVIWVKCPGDGSDTFYMFVSNSTASQYSNGSDTFAYFEDFEEYSSGDTVTGWTADNPALTFKADDTYVYDGSMAGKFANSSSTAHRLYRSIPISLPFRIILRGYRTSSTNNYLFGTLNSDTTVSALCGFKWTGKWAYWSNGSNYEVGAYSTNTWYKIEIRQRSDNYFQFLVDDTDKTSGFVAPYASGTVDRLQFNIGRNIANSWCDNYFVAKYSTSPPSWSSFGSWTSITTEQTYTISIVSNLILETELEKRNVIDLLLSRTITQNYISDLVAAAEDLLISGILDIILSGQIKLNIDLDTILEKLNLDRNYISNTLLEKLRSNEINLDTLLRGLGVSNYDINTIITKLNKGEGLLFDLLIGIANIKVLSSDIILKALNISKQQVLDAILKSLNIVEHMSFDSIISELNIPISSIINMVLERLDLRAQFMVDALLQESPEISYNFNIAAFRTITKSIILASLLSKLGLQTGVTISTITGANVLSWYVNTCTDWDAGTHDGTKCVDGNLILNNY